MIDTISVISDAISEDLAKELEKFVLRKQAIHNGNILYSFDMIPYIGSYTNKVNIVVSREKYIYNEYRRIAEKISCKPYIRLEGSLHKFFLGHNCFGGSNNINYMFKNMINKIECDLNLKNKLPYWEDWIIKRIDYAKIYRLNSQEEVVTYFNSLHNVTYPRGKVTYYAGESLYRGGRTTAIKIYNKMNEYIKHDYKIWKKLSLERAEDIRKRTKGIIRIEVEIKNNKFKYDYGREIKIKELDIRYLEKVYNEEIRRLLNEGEEMKKELKNNAQVRLYLQNKCSESEFKILYAFYNDLSINGKDVVRSSTSKTTFYRNLKKLRNLGINYINTDIVVKDSCKFNPFLNESDDTDMIVV